MHALHAAAMAPMTNSRNYSSSKQYLPSSSDSSSVRLTSLRRRGILLSADPIHVATSLMCAAVSLLEVFEPAVCQVQLVVQHNA
jgi:hypothetical protein